MRRTKTILSATLAFSAVPIALSTWGWLQFVATGHTQHVNRFRFVGHRSLHVDAGSNARGPLSVGRKGPEFAVRTLGELALSTLLREEHSAVVISNYPAIRVERTAFAPGHGGRDHVIATYIPELDAGLLVNYRTHDEDHDASIRDHLEAWRSKLWAREVLSSLEWEAHK